MAACAVAGMLFAACASPGGAPPSPATEAEWRALAEPRPAPLTGAPRVALAGFELAGTPSWTFAAPVPADLALAELVVAGLLRRRDVELVERRRFAAAAEAERAGTPRPPGAPPAGVSRGAELTVTAVWLPLVAGQAAVEIRLASSATGAVADARRVAVPADAEPLGVARVVVGAIVAAIEGLDRLPEWDDPVDGSAPATYLATGVPDEALQRFLLGLAAEEQWNWEGARRSYEAAAASSGFYEAEAALARTARLRMGGTLGES